MKRAIIAVVVCVLLDGVLGALWYSPFAFGEAWHRLQGLDAETLNARGWVHGVSLLGNIVKMSCLFAIMRIARVDSPLKGVRTALVCWLAFVVTIWLGSTLYADRSMTVYAINMSFHLIVFTIAGAIMGALARER